MKSNLYLVLLVSALSLAECTTDSDTSEESNDNTSAEEGNNNEEVDQPSKEQLLEPPGLSIQVGDETVNPVPGTYSWSVENEDGTITATEVDIAPPPELVRTIDAMEVTEDTPIELNFEAEPDRYSVRILNEQNNVTSESDEVDLSGEGKVIYEVMAHWDQGTATYAFSLIID
ncbi:MAG: hypothetical protein JJU16_01355 [Alkalibacterium sp.]|nr:hypothetical protein [Alkalibacterium sp.]